MNEHKVVQRCAFASVYAGAGFGAAGRVWAACFDGQGVSDEISTVSQEILDQWSYEPGFPVIRRNGGHFVRIHRAALERWLEQFAVGTNQGLLYNDAPKPAPVRRRVRR